MYKENIAIFKEDQKRAYQQLLMDYLRIGQRIQNNEIIDLTILIRQAVGRCGSAIGAAAKRAKRRHVLKAMNKIYQSGMDITPAVAQGSAHRLLGRGFDSLELIKLFATPGRTAANKSQVTENDLIEFEEELVKELETLALRLRKCKEDAKLKWFTSEKRANAIKNWEKE